MRIFSFAVLLIEVSAVCVDSSIIPISTSNKKADRNIIMKTFDKSRIIRCSPKAIRPVKRIAPAWSLKDLYETNYHTTTEDKNDGSVKPLSSIANPKNKLMFYIPYTRLTTTESSTPKFAEETSTETTKHTTIKVTKAKKLKNVNLLFTSANATNNYHQKKSRKLNNSHPKTTSVSTTSSKITQNTKAPDDKDINFEFLSKSDREYDDLDQTNFIILNAIKQLKNQGRGLFGGAKNKCKEVKPLTNDDTTKAQDTSNIITASSMTTSVRERDILSDINKHFNDHTEDTNVFKRYNHQYLSIDNDITPIWKRRKAITPATVAYTEAYQRKNTRQFHRSGQYIVDKLRNVLINYDISRRPQHTHNSFQKFGLVYVPRPLKYQARYNYLNHYPVNPRMQVLLSNYGYYLPGSLGIQKFRSLYNHLAYNNMYQNRPFGAVYKIEPDADPWFK